MIRKYSKGFTLIELLVVIAIIGVLSTFLLGALNSARAKARDAQTIANFREVKTALALYFDKYGYYPLEPMNCPDPQACFTTMAQDLVAEGFLSSVPVSPNPDIIYDYYNYGTSGPNGASGYTGDPTSLRIILHTTLESAAPSMTGISGSCRPFHNVNWCRDNLSDTQYCVCISS